MLPGISPIKGLVKFKELSKRLQKHPKLLKHQVVCCVRAATSLQNLAENTVNCIRSPWRHLYCSEKPCLWQAWVNITKIMSCESEVEPAVKKLVKPDNIPNATSYLGSVNIKHQKLNMG